MGDERKIEMMKSRAFPDCDVRVFFFILERVIAELLIAVKKNF
jgi:hypothetical protein